MPTAVTEKGVLEIWQDALQNRTDLLTEENEPVRIVYPGRRNDGRGADFKDAVIVAGRKRFKGDIEIHVKASNWWAHGHHRDPAYNRVILHVVYQNDSAKAIILQNGSRAPTLALHDYIENSNRPHLPPAIPCRNAFYRGNTDFIGRVLDEAGEHRFLLKTMHIKKAIAQVGVGQALYRGLMTALGYSKNKQPMEELAGRVPLEKLEKISNGTSDIKYLARCQALLTGAAGLLPSQRSAGNTTREHIDDDWEAMLENIWAKRDEQAYMSPADWCFFKVRPGNHPVRRLAAMSYLLLRYREKGLLAGLEEKLREAGDDGGRFLEQALLIAPDSYWSNFLDFGVPVQGAAPALSGRGRAADIVVNVLLPFGYVRGPTTQSEKVMAIYRQYSAPAENALVKHMRRQLGVSIPFVATARRQQGLIHIYKTSCVEGKCRECPMNLRRD